MNTAETVLAASFDRDRSPFFAKVYDLMRRSFAQEGPRNGFIDECIHQLMSQGALTDADAEAMFKDLIAGPGRAPIAEDQIGSLLLLLRPEHLPASTIATFAKVMRAAAVNIHPEIEGGSDSLGDTCGTGSDTLGTYNVSTTIMFVLAAAGVNIAKHGNRAVTSLCGSADVLSELEIRIDLDPDLVRECIERCGIGFMYAPIFHRAFDGVQKIRRILADELPPEISKRTVFNVLGPLSNPANAQRQIIGVYEESLVPKFAEILKHIGIKRAIVVFGRCDGSERGLDEFSTAGTSIVAEVRDGSITEWTLDPEEVGLPRVADPMAFAGGDKGFNADILISILSGTADAARTNLALLNSGAGLFLSDKAATVREGVQLARDIIASGAPIKKFSDFRDQTQELKLLMR